MLMITPWTILHYMFRDGKSNQMLLKVFSEVVSPWSVNSLPYHIFSRQAFHLSYLICIYSINIWWNFNPSLRRSQIDPPLVYHRDLKLLLSIKASNRKSRAIIVDLAHRVDLAVQVWIKRFKTYVWMVKMDKNRFKVLYKFKTIYIHFDITNYFHK